MLILILLLLINPIIELELIQTRTIEYLSMDSLYEKFDELSQDKQAEIVFGLVKIYRDHPTHLNMANASVKIEYRKDTINVDSFFQGNRLKIQNLPLEEIKSFIFMK